MRRHFGSDTRTLKHLPVHQNCATQIIATLMHSVTSDAAVKNTTSTAFNEAATNGVLVAPGIPTLLTLLRHLNVVEITSESIQGYLVANDKTENSDLNEADFCALVQHFTERPQSLNEKPDKDTIFLWTDPSHFETSSKESTMKDMG